jgi:hypothetical protein
MPTAHNLIRIYLWSAVKRHAVAQNETHEKISTNINKYVQVSVCYVYCYYENLLE